MYFLLFKPFYIKLPWLYCFCGQLCSTFWRSFFSLRWIIKLVSSYLHKTERSNSHVSITDSLPLGPVISYKLNIVDLKKKDGDFVTTRPNFFWNKYFMRAILAEHFSIQKWFSLIKTIIPQQRWSCQVCTAVLFHGMRAAVSHLLWQYFYHHLVGKKRAWGI